MRKTLKCFSDPTIAMETGNLTIRSSLMLFSIKLTDRVNLTEAKVDSSTEVLESKDILYLSL